MTRWRDSFEKRRCLIPVTCFAEPKEVTPATWHWFALNGEEPRPLFAFDGLWRRHIGPIKKDGPLVELDVYSFMTTTPNELIGTINHERMPVLLSTDEEFDAWMAGTPNYAFALLRKYPRDRKCVICFDRAGASRSRYDHRWRQGQHHDHLVDHGVGLHSGVRNHCGRVEFL